MRWAGREKGCHQGVSAIVHGRNTRQLIMKELVVRRRPAPVPIQARPPLAIPCSGQPTLIAAQARRAGSCDRNLLRSVFLGGWARLRLRATPLGWVDGRLAPSTCGAPGRGASGRSGERRQCKGSGARTTGARVGAGGKTRLSVTAGCTGRGTPKVEPRSHSSKCARASRMLGPTRGPPGGWGTRLVSVPAGQEPRRQRRQVSQALQRNLPCPHPRRQHGSGLLGSSAMPGCQGARRLLRPFVPFGHPVFLPVQTRRGAGNRYVQSCGQVLQAGRARHKPRAAPLGGGDTFAAQEMYLLRPEAPHAAASVPKSPSISSPAK